MTQKLKLVVFVVVFQFHCQFLGWVAGQNIQTQNTQAQNTQAQNTQAQITQAQNTQAQNTQAQNTQAQNTQSPKIPKHWCILGVFDVKTLLII